jgi:hypothetical protein
MFTYLQQRSRYSDYFGCVRNRGLPSGRGKGISVHQDTLTRPWSNHTSVQRVPEYLSTRKKWAGRKLGYLPPTNAKIKKKWNFAAIPPKAFKAKAPAARTSQQNIFTLNLTDCQLPSDSGLMWKI